MEKRPNLESQLFKIIKDDPLLIDWLEVDYKKISLDLLWEFRNYVDWSLVYIEREVSPSFIRKMYEEEKNGSYSQVTFPWDCISQHQKLPEDFIREFKDEVWWTIISYHQELSEDFIREFKDIVVWSNIVQKQKLSEEFLVEFIDNVSLYWLERNENVSEDILKRIQLLKGVL
jgi:hypothetical protein